ncbi:50S ribosomal protein L33 [Bacteroides heparinolyticus]
MQVVLECTEHKDSGMPGTSRYITTKNRKNTTERLELISAQEKEDGRM